MKTLGIFALFIALGFQAHAATPAYTGMTCGGQLNMVDFNKMSIDFATEPELMIGAAKGKTYLARGISSGGAPGIELLVGKFNGEAWDLSSMQFIAIQGPRLDFTDNTTGTIIVCKLVESSKP